MELLALCFAYQRRHQLGLVTVPSDGRTFYQLGQIDLLPNVLPILKNMNATSLNRSNRREEVADRVDVVFRKRSEI